MKSKKNPKADVQRNSSIYFAVGLVLMLLVAHFSLNYQTQDREANDVAVLSLAALDEEIIPITDHPVTPPPKVPEPVIPDEIKIIDNDKEIKESLIDISEIDETSEIIDIEDIIVDNEPEEDVPVPFVLIEDVPIFPGCETVSKKERRTCMSDKITKHVQKKFNVDLAESLGITGKQRISVMFKIDKNGNIVGVQSRAPHQKLEAEAARVINLLPKMKPGMQRGEAVTVQYSLPIVFQVQN